jgi:4'-phosphopantetheinyl transferase
MRLPFWKASKRPGVASRPDVWRISLDESPEVVARFLPLLSDGERRRAGRFRQSRDRARYIISRGSLRRLLSSRLDISSERLMLGTSAFGKPFLAMPSISLHFNTSHSGQWILHAFDTLAPLGIDVEQVRPELGNFEDFTHVLSPEECAHVARSPQRHRAAATARIWVRKEAYVKAIGKGVSRSLRQISIDCDRSGKPRLVYDHNAPGTSFRYFLEDIPVDASHVACLARAVLGDIHDIARPTAIRDFHVTAVGRTSLVP